MPAQPQYLHFLTLTSAMVGTALALGVLLAYLFGGFMARPLDAATTTAAAVVDGSTGDPPTAFM